MSMMQMLLATSAGDSAPEVADVFSVDTYTGNGSTKTITNGVDLSSGNNLVWIIRRNGGTGHVLTDSVRGVTKSLAADTNATEITSSIRVTSFNSNGFSLDRNGFVNSNGDPMVAWTFKGAQKFFDVVTYTGNGANRTISHNLGAEPGFIAVKARDDSRHWSCYHPAVGNTKAIFWSITNTPTQAQAYWNNTDPTDSVFTVGTDFDVNQNGTDYVAYLFAKSTDNLIKCDSYTGNGSSNGPTVNLGFRPQYIFIRRANAAGEWNVLDTARGITNDGDDNRLLIESNVAEFGTGIINLSSTGFQLKGTNSNYNLNGGTYLYVAIAEE